jgi:ABC-type multidrug transport system fused ATPase/permease subunit
VCDEATASIDSETDALVQQSLRDMASTGITTITIAHRLSTIADADVGCKPLAELPCFDPLIALG